MNEIQKARCKLEQICEKGDPGFRDLKPEGQVLFIQQLAREAIALLPPEGETRGPLDADITHAILNDNMRGEGYRQLRALFAEPAPSSEKAQDK